MCSIYQSHFLECGFYYLTQTASTRKQSGKLPENKMENLYIAGIVLAVGGALNLGLIGLFKFDLVGGSFLQPPRP